MSGERRRDFVRRSLGDARALPGTSILTSAASRGTVPRCRRTSRRLRDVPSSRFTRHRPSGATLQRRFGGSANNAPREQPTGNLDGRRVKCSPMLTVALISLSVEYHPPAYQNLGDYSEMAWSSFQSKPRARSSSPFCETNKPTARDPLSVSLRALVGRGGAPYNSPHGATGPTPA